MRILFGIKALAAGPGGGAERILTKVSSALADRGHEVSVLTFDKPGTEDFYRVGPSVCRIRVGIGKTNAKSGPFTTAARLKRIKTVVDEVSPDVVVGFMHSSYTILGLALLGTRVPVIGSERTAYQYYRLNRFDLAMLIVAQPFLAGMTVNGDGVRQGFPRFIRKRMTVIPNPVAIAHTLADPTGGASKTLLCVGGLRSEKNHEALIRAFATVFPQHPGWRLRIVGEGALRSRLMRLIKELSIEPHVHLVGATASVEMEYQTAQLFALPSLYEGFPNCLAEALAHGLPVIGFADCPGTNRLIETGINGILVSDRDRISGLAAALDELMSSPEKRRAMGTAAVDSVVDYSLDGITDKWEELLRDVAPQSHLSSFLRSRI
jgi:glycosyltransferase involved in cell wall biosynthesis